MTSLSRGAAADCGLSLGARLAGYMGRAGRGTRELAGQLGCDAGYISQLVHDQRRPSPGLLDRIAEHLALSAEETRALHLLAARAAGYRV